jgi:Gene product 88
MRLKQFKNAPVLTILQNLAVSIQNDNPAAIVQNLQTIIETPRFSGPGWQLNLRKLLAVFQNNAPMFSVFAMGGNVKLPFVAFSSLPGVTCPGAGECIEFCYSFRAWRYPAAFARMAQNAYLLRFNPSIISGLFRSIAIERPDGFDFRLYVDGDFSNVSDVSFWMETLKDNPSARAYGYSKSFAELLAYDAAAKWPGNYMLNLSSGHNADNATLDAARGLKITRGEFRAVSIGRKVTAADHGTAETNRALRAALPDDKIFPCPGKCGSCTGAGHACGMPKLSGRIIAIAMH